MNVTELRNKTLKEFEKLENGESDIQSARAMSKLAGNAISSAVVQMEYNSRKGNRNKDIEFLNGN